jgi:hypothetical protein
MIRTSVGGVSTANTLSHPIAFQKALKKVPEVVERIILGLCPRLLAFHQRCRAKQQGLTQLSSSKESCAELLQEASQHCGGTSLICEAPDSK